ncbi:MAG: HAMP domain-containing protein [Acidobacteriia bacterium]|nr:HAMP domain-containing protein [Terriglobia bacterium]
MRLFLFATPGVRMNSTVAFMGRPTTLGLQSKIIIFAALAFISVVGVSTYIAMLLTRTVVEEEIYLKAVAQARATAHQLVSRRSLEDPAILLRELRQMEKDFAGVQQADVYLHEPEHRLIASTAPPAEHLELDNIPGIEKYNEFERPDEDTVTIETPGGKSWIIGTTIRDHERAIACLNLEISKSQTSRVTRGLVLRNLVLTLASLGLIVLVIHVFFLKRVRGPVKEMVRVMEAAEGGQLNVRARAGSEDEIGALARHLNQMLGRIENFNTELGRRVEEATAELARRNAELARINQELFETQRTLAHSERLAVAGQLAASLAHQIGTPLNSISGHVQLLARRAAKDEALARRLQIIESQIEHIVRTVKQLLSWTHSLELHLETMDLRDVLREAVLLSSPALEHRKIRMRMDLAADVPNIYGDAGYLQQVFLNLINNSMDAMPEGGELKVSVGLNSDGQSLQVDLEDTGHGMSAETLSHIFEPMFTTKRMGTGSGLGLAICDQIVRQHAGTIKVESAEGRGTRFTIILPLDCRPRLEAVAPAAGTVSALP